MHNNKGIQQFILPAALLMLIAVAVIWLLARAQTPNQPTSSPIIPTSPVDTPVSLTPLPNPDAGTGHVVGRVVSEPDSAPFPSAILFLGDVLTGEGDISGVGLEPERSPDTQSDPNGYFAFANVPPGEYSLIWWVSHRESYALGRDEGILIVQVKAGEVTDLGDVSVGEQ